MGSDDLADALYRVVDADGDVLEAGTYESEDDALSRRAHAMADHPDGDEVTIEKYERVWSDAGEYSYTLNGETRIRGEPTISGARLYELADADPEGDELVERDENDHYVTHWDARHEIDLRDSHRFVTMEAGGGRT